VVAGEVAPSVLAACPADELATHDAQATRAALTLLAAPANGDAGGAWMSTDAYVCESCGAAETQYQAVGGQRDIRKAEVWGTAGDEGERFQVRCVTCAAVWFRTAL
jgi:hypothetical protein